MKKEEIDTCDVNIGRVKRLCDKLNLNLYEEKILIEIGVLSVGNCENIATLKDGTEISQSRWSTICCIGSASFRKYIKSLIDKDIVTLYSGINGTPNRYGINFKEADRYGIKFNFNQ